MKIKFNKQESFVAFFNACETRLRQGQKEYEDKSFSKTPLVLLSEIEEELMDVATWAYILFARLQKVRRALFTTDLDDEMEEYETYTSEHRSESKQTDLQAGEPG